MAKNLRRKWQVAGFGCEYLQCIEEPVSAPDPGEILVRVESVSLNHRDLLLVGNQYGWTPPLSFTPGSDVTGVVIGVGEGVARFRSGEKVIGTFFADWIDGPWPTDDAMQLGRPGPGILATHVILDAKWAVQAAPGLSAAQNRTLPCAALTLAGGENISRSLDALAPNGVISVIGLLEDGSVEGLAFQTVRTRAVIRGIHIGHRQALEGMRAIEVNAMQPVIAGEYVFDDVPAAFSHVQAGPFGKVVVTFEN